MSLLATLRAKKHIREVATLTVATDATHEGIKAPTVARVATVTVACAETSSANDSPVVGDTFVEAKREAYEERAAIMEHMGGIEKSEAERMAALQTWPNTQAMNPGEVATFTARLSRFTNKGASYDDAERLADKLVLRDREGDDRRLCLECNHLQGYGRWKCSNWQAADVARQGLARELVLQLTRCCGFLEVRFG
jgi:hypothetical protein